MNLNKLFSFALSLFLLCSMSITSYAALPIEANSVSDTEKSVVVDQVQSESKYKKLKHRLTKKVLVKKMEGDNKTAAIVFAILIPFVGVAIYQDRIGRDFWITLLLTLLLYVPGLIYALSIVLKRTR